MTVKSNFRKQSTIKHLPKELTQLVDYVLTMLGSTIKLYEGDAFYQQVESFRKRLKPFRQANGDKALTILYRDLNKLDKNELIRIGHAFSMLLELMNVCEAAYRTWYQRQQSASSKAQTTMELSYVLTAHPTEAKSNEVVMMLKKMADLLVDGMQKQFIFNEPAIDTVLGKLWQYPLVKTRKTTVHDEAEYIYSIIFSQPLFDFIISNKPGYQLALSTWVGGDKDGHPGVNADVMKKSLTQSRRFILKEVRLHLMTIMKDLQMLNRLDHNNTSMLANIKKLLSGLQVLKKVQRGDGKRVHRWLNGYCLFVDRSSLFVQRHVSTIAVQRIAELFPALVVPLELRDSSDEIAVAIHQRHAAIRRMLVSLKSIVSSGTITHYVHGLIISHCRHASDLDNALRLVRLAAGTRKLPVVPLFEDRRSLEQAAAILKAWLDKKSNLTMVKQHWQQRLEIMLGYSDSAKQIGVLPSRFLIRESMYDIERVLKRYGIIPIFFHGSGGSVERGGGSIDEQIAWWSDAAIKRPKLTVQGEMVQRRFSTPEILNAECQHLSHEAEIRRSKKSKRIQSPVLEKFTGMVEGHYLHLIQNKELLSYCLQATPYKFMSVLKLGSRPSKRPEATVSLSSLRAIPWILAWTQTRLLFPTWWGVGAAWAAMPPGDRARLKTLYRSDPFFSSFVKILGFTLAKVELPIWRQYLMNIYGRRAMPVYLKFEHEYKRALAFHRAITQSKSLIGHRLWLEESISLRAPYVHLLNLLQIIAIKTHDEKLLKETLAGIASGMLTTG